MGKVVVRFLLIAFFCSLFVGCASKRITTSEITESATEAKFSLLFEKALSNYLKQGRTSLRLDSLSIDQTIHLVIYDTERQDSLGNCPVKVEADITTKANDVSQVSENDSLTSETKDEIRENIGMQRNDSLIHKEDKDKKVSFSPALDLTSFSLLCVVILLVIVSIKFYKK